jgi:hypothetical protein
MSAEPATVDQRDIALINQKIERLLDRTERLKEEKKKEEGSWLGTAAQVIGIPAAIVAVMMNFGQVGKTDAETTKITAETKKVEAETLKTRAELENLSRTLQQRTPSANPEVDRLLSQVSDTVAKLDQIRSASLQSVIADILLKYIFLFAAFKLFYFGTSIFSRLWDVFTRLIADSTRFFIRRRRQHLEKQNRQMPIGNGTVDHYERMQRLSRFESMTYTIVGYSFWIPQFAIMILEFILIISFIVPLFLETGAALGKLPEATMALERARKFELGGSYEALRSVLRTSSGSP